MDRLPRGRHGLSPEFVAQNQRERLITGLIQVLYEVGYQKTTVSLIGQKAAVSKSDFYKHFESKDDCFIAAYETAVGQIGQRIHTVCAEEEDESWVARTRLAIEAMLALFSERPALASIVLVEGLRAGRDVHDCYQKAIDSFVCYLRRGAPPGPGGAGVPEATDEAIVGGIVAVLGRRVLAGESERLAELYPEVLEFALTPYLGAEQARRIVSAG
jgi:AcrR family transcriptional regulator